MNETAVSILITDWSSQGKRLSDVRREVFIEEQHVPKELEWDGRDDSAIHAMAVTPDGRVVGTARLLPDGQIGRMAVLPSWREQGIGTRLLMTLVTASNNKASLFLNAQTSAEPFYRNNGFTPEGDIFMEAGIPHVRMIYTPSR